MTPRMIVVERVSSLTPEVQKYLEGDLIGNAYALYFTRREANRSILWVARQDGRPCGHLILYNAQEFSIHWAYLAGEPDIISQLLRYLPTDRMALTIPSESASIIRPLPGVTEIFQQKIMAVHRGEERLVDSSPAVRLTPKDADAYVHLVVPPTVPITDRAVQLNRELLQNSAVYGIFTERGELVSVAGAPIHTADVWLLSGVETATSYRRRGFGAKVVSAVTRDALKAVATCGLFVDRTSGDAIRLYERLGFRTLRECTVVDFGTGMAH